MKIIIKLLVITQFLFLSINAHALMARTVVIAATYESYFACAAAQENIEFDKIYLLMRDNRNEVNGEGDQIPLSLNPRFDTDLLKHYRIVQEIKMSGKQLDCNIFASVVYDSLKEELDANDMSEYVPMSKKNADKILSLLK
ncbi:MULTISPECIES: hypothetical protein [Proteus]|uniref:Uncharacterized protein n=1 Tax=Proteus penneri TaxID=102862 RepID=A0ABS0VZH9_9GAMM|nr:MULTISPECIES: hypothetical protein [Proteus]MBJ2116122.1 hypothetical protein [Proteus penneri]MCO8052013.1 hypothetical protein [Proteus penneri]NBM97260.1 hypothetical protein [Proteus sp. G2660]QPT34332.1 hypothetical protein I6G31_02635 [Proteus penneri]